MAWHTHLTSNIVIANVLCNLLCSRNILDGSQTTVMQFPLAMSPQRKEVQQLYTQHS